MQPAASALQNGTPRRSIVGIARNIGSDGRTNQKVASALYQAQSSKAATIKGSGSSPAPRPLSLEEISIRRRTGQTWGQIFRDMKAQGLVHERTLGQVVANYLKTADEPPRMLVSDRSTGRTSPLEVESHGYAETAQGIGKGGK